MKNANKKMSLSLLLIVFWALSNQTNAQTIINGDFETDLDDDVETPTVYPVPECYTVNSDYELTVNGVNVPLIEHAYYAYEGAPNLTLNVIYGLFYFENIVTVELTKKTGSISNYSISPKRFNITPERPDGSTLRFAINEPRRLYIKVDGLEILVFGEHKLTNQPPSSGSGIFNITDPAFGAVSSNDNTNNQLANIQAAVDAASAYGLANGTQGTVYFPAGVYYTAEVLLKDNVSVYLEGGSVVRGTGITEDYGSGIDNRRVFLASGSDLGGGNFNFVENIKIYGPGTVDANGLSTSELPTNQDINARNGHKMRVISMAYARNITVEDVIARESTSWHVAFDATINLDVNRIKVIGHRAAMHNDGIDVRSCQNVRITNNFAMTVDDSYCIKDRDFLETRNILLDNNVAYGESAAIKMGFAGYNYASDIIIKNSDVITARLGVGFTLIKDDDGNAGTWENIIVDNVTIENTEKRVLLPGLGGPLQNTPFGAIINKDHGRINNLTVKNVTILNNATNKLRGRYNGPIENVDFINFNAKGFFATNFDEARMTTNNNVSNVTFSVDPSIIPPTIANVPIPSGNSLWTLNGTGQQETAGSGRGGSRALSLEADGSVASWNYQLTGLTVGQSYELTGYIRTTNVSGGNAYLQVGSSDVSSSRTGTSAWKAVDVTFTADTNTVTVAAILDADSGTAYFDDLTIASTLVAVTGVSVSPTTTTLDIAETVALTATVAPVTATNQEVTWTSSNEAVATVAANGEVTGVAEGTATITATSEDGGFTATSSITITSTTGGGFASSVDFEAESTTGQSLFAPYMVITDGTASGGAYVVSNDRNTTASSSVAGQMSFDFELSESATVTFSATVDFPNTGDDSFFYRIDGESWQTQNNTTTSGWETLNVQTFSNLSAGFHTLTILRRESGSKIDKLKLSAGSDVFITIPTLPTTERFEVEDMVLSGEAVVESRSDYSNGQGVRLISGGSDKGEASFTFTGISGTYDLTVGYLEENDGQPQYKVFVDGSEVDSWTGNISNSSFAFATRSIVGVSVSNGSEIRITSTKVAAAYGRMDYIELISASGVANARVAASEPEELELGNILVYPNPLAEDGKVTFHIPMSNQVEIAVYDVNGRLVESLQQSFGQDKNQEVLLDLSGNPAGLYIYKVKTVELSKMGKLILK